MRPVLHGMCRYVDLVDSSLSLGDVRLMNMTLDVAEENRRRVREARGKD